MPFPGRRTRKLTRIALVCGLTVLILLGSFSHLLPGTLALTQAGGELELGESAYRIPPPLPDGPRYSLPPGTIQYGSRATPFQAQVSDSSIHLHVASTSEAYVYETSFGQYSFNKTMPFMFSLRSRSGTLLTEKSFFFITSLASLTAGNANVTVAANERFEVRYEVLSDSSVVGHLILRADFHSNSRPKFTIMFTKTDQWTFGSFNIVWPTLTALRWMKVLDSSVTADLSMPIPQVMVGTSKLELGFSSDASLWTEWLTTDWGDAPVGALVAGDVSVAGFSGKGFLIVFPTDEAVIDPTQVGTSTVDFATAYSTQRKTFSYGSYYFLFWYDGSNIVYSASPNGLAWSTPVSTGSGLLNFGFDIYNVNSTVALTWLKYEPASYGDKVTKLLFRRGTVHSGSIAWDPVREVAALPQPYSYTPSVAIGTDGSFWASGIWVSCPTCSAYYVWLYRSADGVSFPESWSWSTSDPYSRIESVQLIPLPGGRLMFLSSHYLDASIRWRIYNPVSSTGDYWTSLSSQDIGLPTNTSKADLISAVETSDVWLVHLIYESYDFIKTLFYRPQQNDWYLDTSLYSGPARYPSIATNAFGNLYAFWMAESGGVPTALKYMTKLNDGLPWSAPEEPFGSGSLITNARWLSATRSASKQVFLAWTLAGTSPYKIVYGSIPLPSGIASSPPSEPWNRIGLSSIAPVGEYVSPGNGLLTVSQTDISVPGRNGLGFSISRIYTQPFVFLQGGPFNIEKSPYPSLGNGWQLGLAWVGPQYFHLANGQIFPLIWTATVRAGTSTTWTMENHEGEDFLFTKIDNGQTVTYKLTMKDGTVYNFDGNGLLSTIVDRTGQNKISFLYYVGGVLTQIADTVGRTVGLGYDSYFRLERVTYGGQTVRYGYSRPNLVNVTNALGRVITFKYSPQNSWLISEINYPTGGKSTYNYGSITIGTDAVTYRVTLQNLYATSLVRSTTFSYQITDGTITYTKVTQSDGVAVQGHKLHEFNARSKTSTVTILDQSGVQLGKTRSWYDAQGRQVQEDVYNGGAAERSFFTSRFYDNWGNIIYGRDALGHETYRSSANTDRQYMFYGPGSLLTTNEGKRLFDDFDTPTERGVVRPNGDGLYNNWEAVPAGPRWSSVGEVVSQPLTPDVSDYITATATVQPTWSQSLLLSDVSESLVVSSVRLWVHTELTSTSTTDPRLAISLKSGHFGSTWLSLGLTGPKSRGWYSSQILPWTFFGAEINDFVLLIELSGSSGEARVYAVYLEIFEIAPWTLGSSASPRGTHTEFSMLRLEAASYSPGVSKSSWARSVGTYTFPFYIEVQMSLGVNLGTGTLGAELVLSPQEILQNGNPFENSDALRFLLDDGPYYRVAKRVGGVQTFLGDDLLPQATSLAVSWKVILSDLNTISVYLNTGSGYPATPNLLRTDLGLPSGFAPSYVYLVFRNSNGASYHANFDFVSVYGSNQVTVNGLKPGQRAELYDWMDIPRATATVPTGQSAVTLNAIGMSFPYGYLKIFETDGRTVQFVSPRREVWGGITYSYTVPFQSGGLTRTGTGFLRSDTVYVEDGVPPVSSLYSEGGDSWRFASPAYAPVVSGLESHVGFASSGFHQHYLDRAYPTLNPTSGSYHVQYVYVPSATPPREIMLQFRYSPLLNPGFQTGDFTGWTQNGMRIVDSSGQKYAGPVYDPSTNKFSTFTLQQDFPSSISTDQISSIRLGCVYGDWRYDKAKVLYSDGTFTTTDLTCGTATYVTLSLNFDPGKYATGIKVQRGTALQTELRLDDFAVDAAAPYGWEHRAYWGSDLIGSATSSRRYMGPMPSARDSWMMLIVKTDDIATNGLNLDGVAYTLYDGGVYWDYTAIGGPSIGRIEVTGLLPGQKVELYDKSNTNTPKTSSTVPSGGSTAVLDLYGAGINVFPFRGYLKVYSSTGSLQYSSPLMTDIWGGDVYQYNQPVFSNSFSFSTIPSTIHERIVGSAQYQNAGAVPEESYYRYDTVGNLVEHRQMHNGSPLVTTYTYDVYGNVLTAVSPKQQTVDYSYSTAYQQAYLTAVTERPNPGVTVTTSYDYDFANGNPRAVIDPMGNRTDYQYDAIGRTTLVTFPAVNGVTSNVLTEYQDSQNAVAVRNEKGNYTRQVYDGLGRTITLEWYSGNLLSAILAVERYTYDWQGRVKTAMAPDGSVTLYDYDYLGRIVKITNPDLTYRAIVHDDVNLTTSRFDENQQRTDFLYDALGRLVEVREYFSDTGYHATSYFYDDVGNLVKVVEPKQHVLTFTPIDDAYIQNGLTFSVGQMSNLRVGSSPQADFLLKFQISGVGTSSVVSAKLRLFVRDSSVNGGIFYRAAHSSWSEANVVWSTAPTAVSPMIGSAGAVRSNTWAEIDLLPTVIADGTLSLRVSSSSSDLADYNSKENSFGTPKLILTLSTGQTTSHSYDDLNRLISTTYPDGLRETWNYDSVGNLVNRTDRNGNIINYFYDSLDRPTAISYPDGTTASYSYDHNGNIVSASNPSASTNFTYDPRNRLTSEVWTINGSTYTLGYKYDSVGNLVEVTYPDSRVIRYEIDPLDRVSTVKDGSNTLASFSYGPNGGISGISYGNGVQTSYSYDSRGRLSRIGTVLGTVLLDLNYGYDPAGNIVAINFETYEYDAFNRLVTSMGPWGTLQYTYDVAGNRLSQSNDTTLTSYTYGTYNRLLGTNSTEYAYDGNGNVKAKTVGSTTTSYTYGFEDRLTRVEQGSSVLGAYAYNPFGQMVKKTESGATTVYLYGGLNVLHEKQGTTQNDYVYAGGLLIARLSGTSVWYFHQDHLGSTRLVTNGSTTEFSTNYQPFGPQYGASGADPGYKYTGKPYSSATGLYYSFQRWYDPEIGRFISQDIVPGSISQPQTLNRYAYVANSPTNYVDPTGMILETVFDVGSVGYDIWELWNNPSWENALWLTLDVGALLIPFVPSVAGPLARAAKAAVKGVNALDNTLDASRAVSTSADLLRITNRLEDLSEPVYVLNLSGDVLNRFDDLYKAGRYGDMPKQLALGKYVDQFVKSGFKNFDTSSSILGRNFPDAWRSGGIIEIKPFHEGVNPFVKYSEQIGRYRNAHFDRFLTDPRIKLILYRFV